MTETNPDHGQEHGPEHVPTPGGGDRMLPEQARATQPPPLRALAYIGLDMTGPGRASILQIAIYSFLIFVPLAFVVKFLNIGGVWLFVAPVLVLLGFFMGRPLDLVFNLFEVAAIVVTMFVVNSITQDGESNWVEGVQLLAAYAILGIAFFFHP